MMNIAYLSVLSLDTISKSTLVAMDATTAMIGSSGGTIAVIGVIIATLGSNNGFILTGARIYYAMATENLFFKPFARVHPKFHTPIPSLIGQGLWACVFVLTGTFDQLFTYVIFASWIFFALSAGAVIVLRKKSPKLFRPYKTWGYPFTPWIFILFAIYLVVNTLIQDPRDALVGLAIILLGLPAYRYWSRQNKNA
jgi:APA family basic amino acid/polyamine antiporter